MAPERLAAKLGISGKTLRAWLRREFPRAPGEKWSAWSLDEPQIAAAEARWGSSAASAAPTPRPPPTLLRATASNGARANSDEAYVIDLCDAILGERAKRQHCFDWLLGDPGRTGVCRQLPVDAYYEGHRLVVEYRERQHDEPTPFFDKRQTVSGVGRGEQRRIYDLRRESEIPKRGLRLVVIRPDQLDADQRGRLRRNPPHDASAIRSLLST